MLSRVQFWQWLIFYGFSLPFSQSLSAQALPTDKLPLYIPSDVMAPPPSSPPIIGAASVPSAPTGVDWWTLLLQSGEFLGIEHAFREMTEAGTRSPQISVPKGYINSVTSLHGWADGDPFLVNYVGHPMQGAVTGFLFIQNDRRYKYAEFGKNSQYWKSRLRAGAFAWAYSEQFEIGLLSEASLGAVQSKFPQYGFVDQVITPVIGVGWIIAEDVLDKYVVLRLEQKGIHPALRVLIRGGLNPSRSMANVLGGHLPWYRYTRGDPYADGIPPSAGSAEQWHGTAPIKKPRAETEIASVPPFEFSTVFNTQLDGIASTPCLGGTGSAAFRLTSTLQLVGEVGGCKMTGMATNWSGDSLHYMVGPRWTPSPGNRWNPYAEILFGGQKITTEEMFPAEKTALAASLQQQGKTLDFPDHAYYTKDHEASGWSMKAGAGVNLKLNSALAVRVAGVDYMHSWLEPASGPRVPNNTVQFTSGIILRMGTW